MENRIGQYRIVAPLTTKTSNPTYRARLFSDINWNYVVKIYNSLKVHSTRAQEGWLRKMEALTHLEHPHILSVSCGIEEEIPYTVTAYVERGSLRDRLDLIARAPLDMQKVRMIISQVGQALQYAHEQRILHGNIKPENVLFDTNGDALLADFSLPKDDDETDHRLPTVGRSLASTGIIDDDQDEFQLTYYLPTEILSQKSDQHALGCLAYEMLSSQLGTMLFSSQLPVVRLRAKEPLPTGSLPTQEWVAQVKAILIRALAEEPGERYENVAAFLAAIEEVFTSRLASPPVPIVLSPVIWPVVKLVQTKKKTLQRPALPFIKAYHLPSLTPLLAMALQIYKEHIAGGHVLTRLRLLLAKALQVCKERIRWRGGVIILALFMLGIFCALLIWTSPFSLHSKLATGSPASSASGGTVIGRTPQSTNEALLQRVPTSTPVLNVPVSSKSSIPTTPSPVSVTSTPVQGTSSGSGSGSSFPSHGSSSSFGGSFSHGSSSSYSGSSSDGPYSLSSPTPTPRLSPTPTPTPSPTPTPRPASKPVQGHCYWGGRGIGCGSGGRGRGGRGSR